MRGPATRRATMLLALLSILATGAPELAGQSPSTPEARRVGRIVYEGDMASLLAALAQAFNVNIGLEVSPSQPATLVKIDLRESTLDDALNAVVSSAPRYRWRGVEGGFEVVPAGSSCPLLDARVDEFHVSGVTQTEAVEQLMSLPEVRAGLSALNLRYESRDSRPTKKGGERFSMSVKGASIRQVLHQIAERSGGRFWSFSRYGNQRDGEFITLRTPDRW